MSSPNPLSAAELLGERTVHNGASGFGTLLQGRAYQVEMLEESMRRNIIVAVLFPRSLVLSAADLLQMDTGSGKTLVYEYSISTLSRSKLNLLLEPSCAYRQSLNDAHPASWSGFAFQRSPWLRNNTKLWQPSYLGFRQDCSQEPTMLNIGLNSGYGMMYLKVSTSSFRRTR